MIQETVRRSPDRPALTVKRNGGWVTWTYRQYEAEIVTVAKAFIKLGLKPHHGVGILGKSWRLERPCLQVCLYSAGHNAPEWHVSNIASVVAGGLAVGIYTTSSVEGLQYKAAHSRANIMVVEDEEQLEKLLECRDTLSPHLQSIVQYTGQPSQPGVLSWSQLLQVGRDQPDHLLQERLDQQAVNQACMVVYTSGTTGTSTRGEWSRVEHSHWSRYCALLLEPSIKLTPRSLR